VAILPALRAALDDAASVAGVRLRATKGSLARVLSCERHHVAVAAEAAGQRALSEPVARGVILDRLLHHHVHGEPTEADAWRLVDDALLAERDDELLAWLEDDPERRSRLAEDAAAFAAEVASWPPLDGAWWPRCEERVRVDLGDGAVVCTARLDLVLGGPGTGRPLVVVEAKSGPFGREHRDGLVWYSLLVALRHGVPPVAAIGWSAFDGRTWEHAVSADLLAAAADRACAAITALGELAGGRAPTATAGPQCAWCPASGGCDAARRDEADL